MLPGTFFKGFDKRRLKWLLASFFVALAVPTGVLIWQAYSQLKWEAFHQQRRVAEELTERIELALNERINVAEARSFADYTFLVVAGNPAANFVQRSPLSEFPVTQDLPGVIGYFQVGADGEFSTPLLPQGDADPSTFGIADEEYEARLLVARNIQEILRDNRLVRHQPSSPGRELASSLEAPADVPAEADLEEDVAASEDRQRTAVVLELESATDFAADKDEAARNELRPAEAPPASARAYSQSVFDELTADRKSADAFAAAGGYASETAEGAVEGKERLNTLGKVSDLNLDAAFQQKSESLEQSAEKEQFRDDTGNVAILPMTDSAAKRTKRKEQIALPESEPSAAVTAAAHTVVNLGGRADLRISTFESEIDPLEFRLLDSGHFVLFRKVWREGQRYIQGLLLDPSAFLAGAFDSRFLETGLSRSSNLIVAYEDDVIHSASGSGYSRYPSGTAALDGALLYRSRLAAPFDGLELIFSINSLPPGPGATILAWVSVVLAAVFLVGFYALYRLGLGQIRLARQQQDFVSAVSHELKTPLTSIRMYGEMLKEGWANPEKQQQYYEFIHDESERLTRLISNVLQLAKITRNEPQFDVRLVTVDELMNQIESKIASQVKRAGFELAIDIESEAGGATIRVDEDCIAQIVINLVDNAIKFSRDAGTQRIDIAARKSRDNRIVFSIRDFGPGVPKNQMKKIFQLFYRPESELTRETVGTGIGLAIVHQLSVAMGGKVDVVNCEPGAEFRIAFPVAE